MSKKAKAGTPRAPPNPAKANFTALISSHSCTVECLQAVLINHSKDTRDEVSRMLRGQLQKRLLGVSRCAEVDIG
jgi:hypothetical protein